MGSDLGKHNPVKPLVCEILILRGGQNKKTVIFVPFFSMRMIQELQNNKVISILPTLEKNWLKITANLDLW